MNYAGSWPTPVGVATAVVDADGALCSLTVRDTQAELPVSVQWRAEAVTLVRQQVDEYFAGRRREFTVPLRPVGSPFQQRVWAELVRIPFGQTVSYGELAMRLGLTLAAARAVGRANATNPIWLIVPCHRVIGSKGALTGYAGGLHRKEALLRLEGRLFAPAQTSLLFQSMLSD